MSDLKTATGKCPLDAVPLASLKGAARVFEHGYHPDKYARGNWYTAEDDQIGNRYAGALMRHLADAQNPDGSFDLASLAKLDDESGLPELDHLICGALILRGLLIKRGALPADPGRSKLYGERISDFVTITITRDPVSVPLEDFIYAAPEPPPFTHDGSVFDHQPRDVHAPSIYPEGDPAGVRPFREGLPPEDPRCADVRRLLGPSIRATEWLRDVDRDRAEHGLGPWHANPRPTGPGETGTRNTQPVDEAARAATALADGAAGRGPRFILVRPEYVPSGAVAEFYWANAIYDSVVHRYNSGSFADFDPANYRRDRHPGSPCIAVVDTRPQEGGY